MPPLPLFVGGTTPLCLPYHPFHCWSCTASMLLFYTFNTFREVWRPLFASLSRFTVGLGREPLCLPFPFHCWARKVGRVCSLSSLPFSLFVGAGYARCGAGPGHEHGVHARFRLRKVHFWQGSLRWLGWARKRISKGSKPSKPERKRDLHRDYALFLTALTKREHSGLSR